MRVYFYFRYYKKTRCDLTELGLSFLEGWLIKEPKAFLPWYFLLSGCFTEVSKKSKMC